MNYQYALSIRLIHEGNRFFGPGPARLLRLIQQQHSIHKAAATMNMSYSKAWRIITDIEKATGAPILLRNRGGSDGGGSQLTEAGEALLLAYEQFAAETDAAAQQLFAKIFA